MFKEPNHSGILPRISLRLLTFPKIFPTFKTLPHTPDHFRFQYSAKNVQSTLFSYLWSTWLHVPALVRYAVYSAMWKFNVYFRNIPDDVAVPLPFGLYGKQCLVVPPDQEASSTQYVQQNTTIPVPTILDYMELEVFCDGPRFDAPEKFILMTAMPGKPLGEAINMWNMTPENLQKLEDILGGWLHQLRMLTPPASQRDAVCGLDFTPFRNNRIRISRKVGPYLSVEAFHHGLFQWVFTQDALPPIVKLVHEKPHRVCFSHGDLHPGNILVDDDGIPLALIDFGCAAWLPEYFEYTRAIYTMHKYTPWVEMFGRIYSGFEQELEAERALWKVHSPL